MRHFFMACLLVPVSLTERLEDGDASAARAGDGVVPDDAAVRGAVEHDAVLPVVVHDVVLDGDVVAPLRSDDAVVACSEQRNVQEKQQRL